MGTLDRRVANLESRSAPEMVFVVYLSNPEPLNLLVGTRTISRLPQESWEEFKGRVEMTDPHEKLAVGSW